MSRETWVIRNGEFVRKEDATPLNRPMFNVLPDIHPFVTQDGKEISSRSALRAYEAANGVKQVGNDYASSMREIRAKVFGG